MSKNRKIGKRLHRGLSILLTFALLFGMTAGFSGPALAAESVLTPSNNGTVTAVNGGNYVISASGTYTGWRFIVPNGVTATLTVSGTLTLNNQNGGGSPIDVQAGGSLSLVVNGALTAYGQNATNGADSNPTVAPAGGNCGYAAIAVPDNATLNAKGSGVINVYGGSAGKGGSSAPNGVHGNASGGGGGGAGAGIGGNGGSGGAGVANVNNQNGTLGGNGLTAGSISFSETIKATAFGGGGGTAGQPNKSSGAGGGGGYPGAGIGGGGAGGGGGDHGSGGGGFSGGGGQVETHAGYNGMGATAKGDSSDEFGSGGGYFSVGNNGNYAGSKKYTGGSVGGGYANTWDWGTHSGEGGTAGAGGNVKIYTASSNIKAYNGNYITTSASGASGNNWGQNPTPIYAQLGYSLDNIRSKSITSVTARTDAAMSSELASKGVAKTIATTGFSGIGSGAGYTESSNGTVQYGTRLDLGTLTADLHLTPDTNNGVPYILFGI